MILIIGGGILGLAAAEFLSRNYKVILINDENLPGGSKAAAANLCTKGQLFARDFHFDLKLKSKKIYLEWIQSFCSIPVESIYKSGIGIDYFGNEELRDLQLKRVLQPKNELLSKNLQLDSIVSSDNFSHPAILYQDEAWVNAELLLRQLKDTLFSRGCQIVSASIGNEYTLKNVISDFAGVKRIIVAAGAWSPQILKDANIALPQEFLSGVRLSAGSTFKVSGKPLTPKIDDFSVLEMVSTKTQKYTLSGNLENSFLSSTTLRFNDSLSSESWMEQLNKTNEQFLANYRNAPLKNSPFECERHGTEFQIKSGLRIGFGHSEIIVRRLEKNWNGVCVDVCAGAHRSGFLFAPYVGHLLQNLQS